MLAEFPLSTAVQTGPIARQAAESGHPLADAEEARIAELVKRAAGDADQDG